MISQAKGLTQLQLIHRQCYLSFAKAKTETERNKQLKNILRLIDWGFKNGDKPSDFTKHT